ncbi:MAG: hypothetical protein ACYC1U_02025 [Candidatus Aquicultorales bacterium]
MNNKSRWIIIAVVAVLSAVALAIGMNAGGAEQLSSGSLDSNKPKLLFFHAAW